MSAPKQRNSKDENEAIKAGETPGEWEKKPAKNAQKDKDARWTKKHGQELLWLQEPHRRGQVAQDHPQVGCHRRLAGTIARSSTTFWMQATRQPGVGRQRLPLGRDRGRAGSKGLKSRIHRRAARNHPLSQKQQAANTVRSRVRARVEHVFGHQENSMGRKIVRTIGMARARFKIGMMNLGYNMRRLVQLERVAAAPA